MVTKALNKTEIEKGFITIPAKNRSELLGNDKGSFKTKLNNEPARVDKQGRIWCSKFLKNKFPISSEVEITKSEIGFEITLNGLKSEVKNIDRTQISQEQQPQSSTSDKRATEGAVNLGESWHKVLKGDCIQYLNQGEVGTVHLTFFDPPYLQGKEYRFFDDTQSPAAYWNWVREIVGGVYKATAEGGAIYFMHREKNAERIIRILRKTGWNIQNLIIWRKKTSAVPIETRFSKQYQIIVYAIKGKKPRVFNKIRIDPPPLPEHKYQHENGVYLTDVWDDIRELTSGYFAGDEAYRDPQGNRIHVQQTPVALLLRIILSSSNTGDIIFDPTAGTGTAMVVAKQLGRSSIGIEIDPSHVELIKKRLEVLRNADDISDCLDYYRFTPNLDKLWPIHKNNGQQQKLA